MSPLTVGDLREYFQGDDSSTPIRAVTPWGSYVFDVVGFTVDEAGRILLRMVQVALACPECAAGKCGNCNGEAWDTATDQPTRCPCHLLEHPRRIA